MGSYYTVVVLQREKWKKQISTLEYNNRAVYDCFNNPFIADFSIPDLHRSPITIDDRPSLHKISRCTPDLLPAAISVASKNSFSTLTTPSYLIDLLPSYYTNYLHVTKIYLPFKGRVNRSYCCRKHGQIGCCKKTRFYCSTCSDMKNRIYYCHGFSMISSGTRTWFLEHQHYISQLFGWLLCLSPFHPFLYLLNLFCACFIPVSLITTCNIPCVCSDQLFDLVFFLTIWMHIMIAWSES